MKYEDGFWASRFHRYKIVDSAELSPLQKELVNAYYLIPLPDGTAITSSKAKTRRTPVLNPFPLPAARCELSAQKLDILADTFGSFTDLSVALSTSSEGNSP